MATSRQERLALVCWLLLSLALTCGGQNRDRALERGSSGPNFGSEGAAKEDDYVRNPDDGSECVCVRPMDCQDAEDGSGLINPRLAAECASRGLICCRRPSRGTPTRAPIPLQGSCGLSKPLQASTRPGEAGFGEWPWQVAILRVESRDRLTFQCGGALIDRQHVLTAAQCIHFEKLKSQQYWLKARLGEWDRLSQREFLGHIDVDLSKIEVNAGYEASYGDFHADIALLRLARPVSFGPHVAPVCLPGPREGFEGQTCVVSGWGTFTIDGEFPRVMKSVNISIVEFESCQSQLQSTTLGRSFNLDPTFLCGVGRDSFDACKGDGGSPLACKGRDGRYKLAGMVSWGVDCGNPDVPGVYTRISSYLDWIRRAQQAP